MKRQLDIIKESKGKTLLITIDDIEKEYFLASSFICYSHKIKYKKNPHNVYLISNLFSQISDDINYHEISTIKTKEGKTLYSRKLHGARLNKLKEKKLLKTN